jgi:6-phosphogluconolactonase
LSTSGRTPGGGSNNPIGLSVFQVNQTDGALTLIQEMPSANPSFVTLDPTRRFLFAVNEIDDYEGQRSGSAEAYAINPTTGTISLLNRSHCSTGSQSKAPFQPTLLLTRPASI